MDAAAWNARYAASGSLWTGVPSRFLAAEVEGLEPGRALDLACGEGRHALWLAERGWRVTGVDFSAVALQRAARLAAERGVQLELVQADLLDYEPPAAAFDLVAFVYLHLAPPDRRTVLARAAAALAPGGTLVVVGHDVENLTLGHGGPRDPEILLTPEAVAAELEGLEIGRAERVRRPVPTPHGEVEAIDTVVRARRLSCQAPG